MIVQSRSILSSVLGMARSPSLRQESKSLPVITAETVQISQAARDALAASASSSTSDRPSIEVRLDAIKKKDGLSRSQEEQDFVRANDKRLAEITAEGKPPEQLSAEQLDYLQKAGGFVNTMANLSPDEKTLYNQAVSSGNTQAAAAIGLIAMTRMMGHTAGGANGTTYDPLNTKISAANITQYFSHSFVDPTGQTQAKFQALIQFLQSSSVT